METAKDDDPLARVQHEQRRCGDVVHPPATPAQIAALREQARSTLGVDLPREYIEFLRRSDGLEFDGLVVYDCASTPQRKGPGGFWQGLVWTNQAWRDNPALRDLLVLAETESDVFALHLPSGSWRRVDRVAHDRHATFASCAAMLDEALRTRL